MRYSFVIIFVVAVGATYSSIGLMEKLEKVNFPPQSQQFGDYFTNLLELKAPQGLQQVITLIQQVLDGLQREQTLAESDHSKTVAQYVNTIQNLEEHVENLQGEKETNQRQISDLSQDVSSVSLSIVSLEKQVKLLLVRENTLRDNFQKQQKAYNDWKDEKQRNLQGINDIYRYLSESILSQSSATVFAEVVGNVKKELGDKHPIVLMIEATSKFDVAQAKRVIDRLELLRDGTVQQIQKEDENAGLQELKFNTLLKQITNVFDRLSSDLTLAQKQVRLKQNDLKLAQRQREEITLDLEQTTTLVRTNRAQSEIYEANFQAEVRQRNEQIKLVQSAFEIVKNS